MLLINNNFNNEISTFLCLVPRSIFTFNFKRINCYTWFFLIFTSTFWQSAERYPWSEKLLWIGIFIFEILALIACNKLVNSIQQMKNNLFFTVKNKQAFQFATLVSFAYLFGIYILIFYIHSIEQGRLAWHEWWNDDATHISEIISLGLLTCFFWIIAQLIREGILYKTENELTI